MGVQAEKKEKVEKARAETLVSVVRIDIIKPLGADWDDVGLVLRRVRWAGARCWNTAMRACYIAQATGKDVAPATEAYRAVNEQMERELEHDPDTSIASEIRVAWSKNASDSYCARRKDIWGGKMSLPSARKDFPIMVSAVGWDLARDGKGYTLSTRLAAGRIGRFRFAVTAEGGNAHARLRELVDPEHAAKHGDLKIKYDEKHKKWFALVTIIRPKPPSPELDVGKKLAIHRGMRSLLTWATSDGETGVLCEGGAIAAFKQQMHARRRSWYAHKRQMPARSRGRGYWRRYEQYRALEDKETNFVKSALQRNAAETVKLAVAKGCGTVVFDDWSARDAADAAERDDRDRLAMIVRNWPFAAQRDAVAWSCKKAGLVLEIVASDNESNTCPACGHVDATQDDGRGTFRCANLKCSIKRSIEAVAAWNMLARAGAGEAYETNAKKRKAIGERLGGAKKSDGARAMDKASTNEDLRTGATVVDADHG